jgi:serine/threonine protein kinase
MNSDDLTRVIAPNASAEKRHEDLQNAEGKALPVGARVGEFEISEVIGIGGFGVVYRAWDHTLERTVAIKEYLPSSLASRRDSGEVVPRSENQRETFEAGLRSFTNEARLLARFDHRCLLKVYRFWQERGTTYMVMPLYVGRTLKQHLAQLKETPEPNWLLNIMDGVTQAIGTMHAEQCFHRDLAPDNIMLLEGSDHPIVLDLGAARRVITDMTQAMTVIVKPGYAPIEQYAEVPDMPQGPWTDIYALGAVLHFTLTRRTPPPSVGRVMSDTYQALTTQPTLVAKYGLGFLSAIDTALQPKPVHRPQSIEAFRALLGLAGAPTSDVTQHVPRTTTIRLPTPSDDQDTTTLISNPKNVTSTPSINKISLSVPPTRKFKFGKSAWIASLAILAGLAAVVWQATEGPPKQNEVNASKNAPPMQAPIAVKDENKAAPKTEQKTERANTAPKALDELVAAADPQWKLNVSTRTKTVRVDQDKFEFSIRSPKPGYLYIYYLSSDGQLSLLFPNGLDKAHRIDANIALNLPRKVWAIQSSGPPGIDRFVFIASPQPRVLPPLSNAPDAIFQQISGDQFGVWSQQASAGLLGKLDCGTAASCQDIYGASEVQVSVVP